MRKKHWICKINSRAKQVAVILDSELRSTRPICGDERRVAQFIRSKPRSFHKIANSGDHNLWKDCKATGLNPIKHWRENGFGEFAARTWFLRLLHELLDAATRGRNCTNSSDTCALRLDDLFLAQYLAIMLLWNHGALNADCGIGPAKSRGDRHDFLRDFFSTLALQKMKISKRLGIPYGPRRSWCASVLRACKRCDQLQNTRGAKWMTKSALQGDHWNAWQTPSKNTSEGFVLSGIIRKCSSRMGYQKIGWP